MDLIGYGNEDCALEYVMYKNADICNLLRIWKVQLDRQEGQ